MGAVANEIDVFGEMYFNNCIAPLEFTATVEDQYYLASGFTAGTKFNIDLDGTAGTYTILYDGLYLFVASASLYPSMGAVITFSTFINDDSQSNTCSAVSFKNSQDTQVFSGSGLLRLSTGDVLTIRAKSDTVPVTLDIPNFNYSLLRMGL